MKSHALLIGINQYHPLAKLSYAKNDAVAFKTALEETCGFDSDEITLMQCEVEGGLRAERDHIQAQLDSLRLRKDLDLLIFGFWGHGFSQSKGHRYLCGISTTDSDPARTAISLGAVNETLRQVGARNTLMILDCCQNRNFGRNAVAPTLSEGTRAFYAAAARDTLSNLAKTEPSGVTTSAILSSCGEGQRAFEWPKKKHGIFTAHLLDGLAMGKTRISDLVEHVQEKTRLTAWDVVQGAQDPFLEMTGGGNIDLARAASPPPELEVASKPHGNWWVMVDGKTHGPKTREEMDMLVKGTELEAESLVWRGGMKNWEAISDLQEWKEFFPVLFPPEFAKTAVPPSESIGEKQSQNLEAFLSESHSITLSESHSKTEVEPNPKPMRMDFSDKEIERRLKTLESAKKAEREWLEIEEKAQKGDSDAQYTVALNYLAGIRGRRVFSKAAKYFQLAARQKHASANFKLGEMHEKGLGQKISITKAFSYYSIANKLGSVKGKFAVGRILLASHNQMNSKFEHLEALWPIPQKFSGLSYRDHGANLVREAANEKCAKANLFLGFEFLTGRIRGQIVRDISERHFELAAKLGDPTAIKIVNDAGELQQAKIAWHKEIDNLQSAMGKE